MYSLSGLLMSWNRNKRWPILFFLFSRAYYNGSQLLVAQYLLYLLLIFTIPDFFSEAVSFITANMVFHIKWQMQMWKHFANWYGILFCHLDTLRQSLSFARGSSNGKCFHFCICHLHCKYFPHKNYRKTRCLTGYSVTCIWFLRGLLVTWNPRKNC